MRVRIGIKNYRCFPDQNDVGFEVDGGFTAFIGANNAGKSSILRLFYEFRHLFAMLSQSGGDVINMLSGNPRPFSLAPGVYSPLDVFHDRNQRDIIMSFDFAEPEHPSSDRHTYFATRLTLTIRHGSNECTAKLYSNQGLLPSSDITWREKDQVMGGGLTVDIKHVQEFMRDLSDTMYIGTFRNTINIGTQESYYDVQVGQAFFRRWHD